MLRAGEIVLRFEDNGTHLRVTAHRDSPPGHLPVKLVDLNFVKGPELVDELKAAMICAMESPKVD